MLGAGFETRWKGQLLLSLNLPSGEFQGTSETEELATAQAFGYMAAQWDALCVREKERHMAYLRDQYDIQRISYMSEDERMGLGGAMGWVRVGRKPAV